MESINTISDLPTNDEISKWVSVKFKHTRGITLNNSITVTYINTEIVNKINNKKDFIKLLLDKSVNRFNQNINYYNVIINYLQDIEDRCNLSKISNKILFTNTCIILYYKINNNIYNLYKFVENHLIDKFNTILLSCLLAIYYLHDMRNNETIIKYDFNDEDIFRNLCLFKYSQEVDNLNSLD